MIKEKKDNIKFELLDHAADIKFRVFGKMLNEIFENSIEALAYYESGGEKIESKKGKVIEVSGNDTESLLYKFIDELLYLVDAERFIAVKGNVLLRGNNLKAELYGDDTDNNQLEHIKAPTYAEMYIKKTEDGWEAQFVLDV
ncbi:archease [Candidatus Pacearchaeota archaeon]|nr:archease [Candidatus Pacearchaeota archaeon]